MIRADRDRRVRPEFQFDADLMGVVESYFEEAVIRVKLKNGNPAYQLNWLVVTGEWTSSSVEKRLRGNDWTQIFGDPDMTTALLDRITHKGHIIKCCWESYQLKDRLSKKRALWKADSQANPVAGIDKNKSYAKNRLQFAERATGNN
jgi:hypothetical protein